MGFLRDRRALCSTRPRNDIAYVLDVNQALVE
jgi:hypothetical protein